jgi:hypothetical protein
MIVKNNKYQKEWHNATKPLKLGYYIGDLGPNKP